MLFSSLTAVLTANSQNAAQASISTNMTTTVNEVDNFLEAFPNKVIKHTGQPDYEILNNIKTALKQNFATVPCTLGGMTIQQSTPSMDGIQESHQCWQKVHPGWHR